MAWTKTKSDADTYFGVNNDVRHYEWVSHSDGLRTAAFNQAIRTIESVLGGGLSDPVISTNAGYRPDYAVYEEALWILQNTEITNANDGTPAVIDLAEDAESKTIERKEVLLSPKARRFLQLNFTKIVRG